MNNKQSLNEVVAQLALWVGKNAKTPAEQAKLCRNLFDGLAQKLLEGAPEANHLEAPNLVVEALAGGYLRRRYLEIEYDESDNGLRLIGENLAGDETQIVFLSETALGRMHELRGQGPETPRCDDHVGQPEEQS